MVNIDRSGRGGMAKEIMLYAVSKPVVDVELKLFLVGFWSSCFYGMVRDVVSSIATATNEQIRAF